MMFKRILAVLAVSFVAVDDARAQSGEVLSSGADKDLQQSKSTGDNYRFVSPYKTFPSADSEAVGLKRIRREGALVYFSDRKRALARQVADVLEKMHAETRRIAGFPISVHGLILLESLDELPDDKRSHWLNVDGVACLVRVFKEQRLPLQDDLDNHMAFAMLIHESVDMGIKETIFTRSPEGIEWRWWLEGLADYCAAQACRKYQPRAFAFSRRGYLDKLNAFSNPTIDVLAQTTWFPKDYTGPSDVNHAYAASHYLIWQLVEQHGDKWITKALHQYQTELKSNARPDFVAIVKSVTGSDIASLVKDVPVAKVKKFATGLDGSQRR